MDKWCNPVLNVKKQLSASLYKNNKILSSKQEEVENLLYEIEILKENSLNLIKNYTDPLQCIDFHSLFLDFSYKGRKFIKNVKENKLILSLIESWFFEDKVKPKLLCIMERGFECQAYEFYYVVGDKRFVISIPIFKTATINSYPRVNYKLIHQQGEYDYTYLKETLFVEDMKDIVKKYLADELKNE